MKTKTAPQRNIPAELRIGERYVTQTSIESELGSDRRLATFSEASPITVKGWYWISAKDVPKKEGYYRDNKDGTFTKVNANDKMPDWSERFYVSTEAAIQASKGKGPLVMCVWTNVLASGRLDILSSDSSNDVARMTSMPLTEAELKKQALKKSKRK